MRKSRLEYCGVKRQRQGMRRGTEMHSSDFQSSDESVLETTRESARDLSSDTESEELSGSMKS